jgi:hypothetical protein
LGAVVIASERAQFLEFSHGALWRQKLAHDFEYANKREPLSTGEKNAAWQTVQRSVKFFSTPTFGE